MAATDYQILQAQVEFPSTSTPRIFFKLGAAVVGTVVLYVVKPNGANGTSVVMSAFGVGIVSQELYYADIADAYVQGQWTIACADDNDLSGTVQTSAFQWGGTIDLLATAATNINDNINGNVGRIQQAVMGNTTWDHTTGTVGMFDGESFVLADEAGTPVSDQSLAVRRINSTV